MTPLLYSNIGYYNPIERIHVANSKVLIFEPIHQKGLDHLTENGAEIVYAPGFSAEEICSVVVGVDAIIARAQGFIDGPVMDQAPNLKVVGRHGIGVDNIDVPAATERGIFVVNTPTGPVEAVAEYVAMSMVALPRKIPQADSATRNTDWEFRNRHHGPELRGKTLGIVGFGRIGRRIAEICGLGFQMRTTYYDVYPAPEEEEKRLGIVRVDLDELIAESDYVTLNVPLLDQTYHLIDSRALEKMKSSAYLINCSRGPVVDESALVQALESGSIAGAVIDVFEVEPVKANNPLLQLENVLLSPHCSGHSVESAQNLSMVASDIIRILEGEKPEFPVNDPVSPRQTVR
jgi:D-3-phosphoglycerate dehydrogenase